MSIRCNEIKIQEAIDTHKVVVFVKEREENQSADIRTE